MAAKKVINTEVTEVVVPAVKAVRAPKHTGKFQLTLKGQSFQPCGKSDISKNKDTVTWGKVLSALKGGAMDMADIYALCADHRSYVGYMVKRGWIAPVAAE
jgi:hypothetical protein